MSIALGKPNPKRDRQRLVVYRPRMGGKFAKRQTASHGGSSSVEIAAFVDNIATEHRPNFDSARALIEKLVPSATRTLKWGTLAYSPGGNLFSLSVSKTKLNIYVLAIGVLAAHNSLLSGIEHEKCVMRFKPTEPLPLEAIETVMRAAIKAEAASA